MKVYVLTGDGAETVLTEATFVGANGDVAVRIDGVDGVLEIPPGDVFEERDDAVLVYRARLVEARQAAKWYVKVADAKLVRIDREV